MRKEFLKELVEAEAEVEDADTDTSTDTPEATAKPEPEAELDVVTGELAQATLQKMRIFVGSIKQLAQSINIKHEVIKNAMGADNDFKALVNSDNQNIEEEPQNEEQTTLAVSQTKN
jgi:hypothetical protein